MIDKDGTIRLSMPRILQQRETFRDWLERMYAERYTGAVVVHFGEGVANEVHVLAPDARIRLDKK